MQTLDPQRAAREAVGSNPQRPATSILLDTPDARIVVFRILPGQAVPPHRSPSSVIMTVLAGAGFLTGEGGAQKCTAGDIAHYEPNELHGMRANGVELHIMAVITPRPGERQAPESGPTGTH